MGRVYEPTEREKEQLREPRGEVVQGEELRERVEKRDYHRLIAVGDRVAIDLSRWGLDPAIAAVDGRIQREPVEEGALDVVQGDVAVSAANPAGGVTREAWQAVREAVARTCSTTVRIDGEEDLLALPAITYASPDSLIVYGQRDVGAVILEPDEALKAFVESLVDRRQYGHVIVGGSWDRLHAGHRSMLLEAFARGEHVDIGVTADAYVAEKQGEPEPLERREEQLRSFLDTFGLEDRARILEIDDYRGNAVEEGEALMVTAETRANGERINEERGERGKEPLDLVDVPLVGDADGTPISSSRIRAGAIDRDGRDPENS
ncbi:MAG: pantetheine-phosphate adenylyltransferase [Candidatus Nanohaloarchaea archaeon]|nr:pantetheine-phosphate adenylyltransferase [Candidatus Nanohaloarchaea archaeon]